MPTTLHIVKEARGGYQIRDTARGAEGEGFGQHTEYTDLQKLEAALKDRGCSAECITDVKNQLANSDNAEIRF